MPTMRSGIDNAKDISEGVYLPVAKTLSTKTWQMSRKAFIGDTLKYRKPRSKPDCMTMPQVRYDLASLMSAISSPYKGVEGCLPCPFCNTVLSRNSPSHSLLLSAPYNSRIHLFIRMQVH